MPNEKAAITRGNSSIGREAALRLARQDDKVLVTGRRPRRCENRSHGGYFFRERIRRKLARFGRHSKAPRPAPGSAAGARAVPVRGPFVSAEAFTPHFTHEERLARDRDLKHRGVAGGSLPPLTIRQTLREGFAPSCRCRSARILLFRRRPCQLRSWLQGAYTTPIDDYQAAVAISNERKPPRSSFLPPPGSKHP